MRPGNIGHLGVKELRSLLRDPIMLSLIVYAFSLAIYAAATAVPETLNRAPIAIVDEDGSPLSPRSPRPAVRRRLSRPAPPSQRQRFRDHI